MKSFSRLAAGLAAALMILSPLAQGDDSKADVTLLFINNSSNSLTVALDGNTVCTLAPRASCTTTIAEIADHQVSAGGGYHIKVDGSECWLDTVVITFTDQDVSQSCLGDKSGG